MITLRPMTKEDFDAILPLQREIAQLHVNARHDFFKEGHINFEKDRFEEFLSTDRHMAILAEENGAAVGFTFMYVKQVRNHPALLDCDMLYIDDICVKADHKRLGIGRMLFAECERIGHEFGCGSIVLDVHSFNEDAIKFYNAIGFMPRKIQMEKKMEETI